MKVCWNSSLKLSLEKNVIVRLIHDSVKGQKEKKQKERGSRGKKITKQEIRENKMGSLNQSVSQLIGQQIIEWLLSNPHDITT